MITKVKNINKNQPFIQKILKKRVNIIRIYRKHHKIYTLYFDSIDAESWYDIFLFQKN